MKAIKCDYCNRFFSTRRGQRKHMHHAHKDIIEGAKGHVHVQNPHTGVGKTFIIQNTCKFCPRCGLELPTKIN